MKSYQKHIRFENIELKVEKSHPKDISRVHFKLIEPNQQVHKTKKYGVVNPTDIIWPCPIQFKYLAQPSFTFQTICQHEYGYQIQELKALYCGQITIKPEDFFVVNVFPVFNREGQKCGKVSFMIKVIDRQIGVKYNEDDQVENKERIRIDLVARISIIEATLAINPLYIKDYEGKHKITLKAKLQLQLDEISMIATQKDPHHWIFKDINKLELFEKSGDHFTVKIKDQDNILLEGKLLIETLLKNKRFITHNVIVQNSKGTKIGILKIEMRIVSKKQILDLMYSPKKLQNVKMQKTDFDMQTSRVIDLSDKKMKENQLNRSINSSEPILHKSTKRMSLDLKDIKSNDSSFMGLSRLEQPQLSPTQFSKNKYSLYFRNQYQSIKFPQASRFKQIRANNPYISYTGQYENSDFSPKRKVKAVDFSKTQRMDFTKPYKNNPGIGDYHLPSIWQKS